MFVHNLTMGQELARPECQHPVNIINMINGHFSMYSFIMKLLIYERSQLGFGSSYDLIVSLETVILLRVTPGSKAL